ncbi:MAG: acetamidase/formamidase family protein [Candidatus Thermoplasmatota archaeon]|nr:acetamidase/formamidase family protein [Candidatus Thermoplasmatota archaeon]
MKVIDGWKDENLHSKWSGDLEPIETISNQETFRVEIPDSSTKQIKENFTDASLKTLDSSKFDMAVGPIYIEEAEPGDLLEVKISKIETSNWGWSAILKDFGLLKGKFDEKLVLWSVANGYVRSARKGFLEGVRIPSRPFLGVVGTAPEEGEFPMIPPQYFGGNMDNRLLGEGSRLYLPVSREGGLLSFADPHASQGDGEVCGTAVETSASVSVSVNVVKNRKTKYPRIESRDNGQGEVLVTQSFSPDLLRGAKEAVEEMIALMAERGFSGEEAYVLCSVAGNLRINEIVDEPNYGVSMVIPAQLLTR